MSALSVLEQELADTLELVRRRRRLPASAKPLTRDLVGEPKPQRHPRCRYCGTPTKHRLVCEAHTDLPELDPAFETGGNHEQATSRADALGHSASGYLPSAGTRPASTLIHTTALGRNLKAERATEGKEKTT